VRDQNEKRGDEPDSIEAVRLSAVRQPLPEIHALRFDFC
jgi:hypothetical protein